MVAPQKVSYSANFIRRSNNICGIYIFFIDRTLYYVSGGMRHSSGEDLSTYVGQSVRKSSKKRANSTRRSRSGSRRDVSTSNHPLPPDSPKLDRHPSLRFSTKRLSHPAMLVSSSTNKTGAKQANLPSSVCVDDCGYTAAHKKEISSLACSRAPSMDASLVRKLTSKCEGGATNVKGSVLSIGTCNDLLLMQPSTSSLSMTDRNLLHCGGIPPPVLSVPLRGSGIMVYGGGLVCGGENNSSPVNRLRVAHSDRDINFGVLSSVQVLDSEQPTVRRSSAEERYRRSVLVKILLKSLTF